MAIMTLAQNVNWRGLKTWLKVFLLSLIQKPLSILLCMPLNLRMLFLVFSAKWGQAKVPFLLNNPPNEWKSNSDRNRINPCVLTAQTNFYKQFLTVIDNLHYRPPCLYCIAMFCLECVHHIIHSRRIWQEALLLSL